MTNNTLIFKQYIDYVHNRSYIIYNLDYNILQFTN